MIRFIWHLISGIRRFQEKIIRDFVTCTPLVHKTVVEIGSGEDEQSCKRFFDVGYFDFIKTDITRKHEHWDITKKPFREKVDVVLCLSVLEHVMDVEKGVENIYKSLRSGGYVIISVPFFYTLHLLPFDYWRFTEFSLKKLFKKFKIIEIYKKGLKRLPFCYVLILRRER